MSNTKEKILKAGLYLFSKKGYLGTTTKDIAKKAGVAELTLFRHFLSKEKLFEEIINRYSFLPTLKDLMPDIKRTTYKEALTTIANHFIKRLSERRDLIRIMYAEIHLYPEKVREIYHNLIDEILKTLASYFRELQSKKLLRDFDPDIGARAFLGMLFSYFNAQEFIYGRFIDKKDSQSVIDNFVDIFIKGTVR